MKIVLDRKWRKSEYTIGRLYIDDEFFCNTLEDTDRGITQTMDKNILRSRKIPNRTAIPAGTYNITLDNGSATTNGTASIYEVYNTNIYLGWYECSRINQ